MTDPTKVEGYVPCEHAERFQRLGRGELSPLTCYLAVRLMREETLEHIACSIETTAPTIAYHATKLYRVFGVRDKYRLNGRKELRKLAGIE